MVHDIENLLHTVYKLPQLEKLSNYKCFDHIIECLNLKDTILSFKHKKIIFWVSHPIQKIELHRKLYELNSILNNSETCKKISNSFSDFEIQIKKQ
ncbi:hypothetical protein ThvES_00011160, partial [Thiovulum sp. ES]